MLHGAPARVPKKLVSSVTPACCAKGVCGTLPYSVGSLKHTAALLTSTLTRGLDRVHIGRVRGSKGLEQLR